MTITEDDIKPIRTRFEMLAWSLDERMRRLFAAAEASALGRGGVTKFQRPLAYRDAQFMSGWQNWLPKKRQLKAGIGGFGKPVLVEKL